MIMARISCDNLERSSNDSPHVHKPAVANYTVFSKNGKDFFQLNNLGTSGTDSKQIIQFSRDDAVKLAKIIIRELNISESELEEY